MENMPGMVNGVWCNENENECKTGIYCKVPVISVLLCHVGSVDSCVKSKMIAYTNKMNTMPDLSSLLLYMYTNIRYILSPFLHIDSPYEYKYSLFPCVWSFLFRAIQFKSVRDGTGENLDPPTPPAFHFYFLGLRLSRPPYFNFGSPCGNTARFVMSPVTLKSVIYDLRCHTHKKKDLALNSSAKPSFHMTPTAKCNL